MKKFKGRNIHLILGLCLFMSVVCSFKAQKALAAPAEEEQELDYILGRPMTEEEIQEQKALEPELQDTLFEEEELVPSVGEAAGEARAVPLSASFDSRTLEVVSPVKDQGKWGTCWSHAIIACAESSLLSKKMMTMEETDLSELHLAYFMYHSPLDPLGNAVGDKVVPKGDKHYLSRGGSPERAIFLLANYIGFANESMAPYDPTNLPEDLDESLAYLDAAHLKNAYWIAPSDTVQIKRLLMEFGAASDLPSW